MRGSSESIKGSKVDWSRVNSCIQKKDETVTEYTERFGQVAAGYRGIADTPETVL